MLPLSTAIYTHMEHHKVDYLDTFYIQLDNTSANKSWTLIAGLGALTLAGIVRKIKISYLLVGHTHEDVDAVIGKVLGAIRKHDMFTYEQYYEQCRLSILKHKCRVIRVRRLIGIPDYDAIFSDFNSENVTGIFDMQQIRLTSVPDASALDMKYRTDTTKPGWLPR